MATSKRRNQQSKGFYRDLNKFSTAGYCENRRNKVSGTLYEVERVVSAKTLRGKIFYLCKWKGYGPLTDTWEPEENLNIQAVQSFKNPVVSPLDCKQGAEAIGLGLLRHLRLRHGNSDAWTTVEVRHDVFRYIFANKGPECQRKGWGEYEKDDFCRCQLLPSWDKYIDHLGDGKQIAFPVLLRPAIKWGPKCYKKNVNGQFEVLPRYYRETVQICFSSRAYTVS